MKKKFVVIVMVLLFLLFLGTVSASNRVSATSYDYFAYYGKDTPAGATHSFAIEVDSGVYYISDSVANKLASYSYAFRRVYDYDLSKYSNMFMPDAVSYGGNGFNAYYSLNRQVDDEMFTFANDKSFDFDYVSGKQVGYNRDAKVITRIYYPSGGEITGTYY